ncbi:MAG: cyclase family protein [Minwuia sp.]|uniref:cyclase family protein n=1 Tax=Minwuia sp. TaxID=2493630 RepID=UPI003A8ACE2F
MTKRWQNRPEGSEWGDHGADDELGRVNLITAEKVKQGVAEVKEGKTFCLSLPLDYPGGNILNVRRHPPRWSPTFLEDQPYINFPLHKLDQQNTDVVSDDQVTICLQYSTQWDALSHVGSFYDADGDGADEKVYFNGYRAGEHVVGPQSYDGEATNGDAPAARRLGIQNFAEHGMQGRGVLIDLEAHVGRDRTFVDFDMLSDIMKKDGVTVEKGDMVLFRTGFADEILSMNRNPSKERLENSCAVLNGRDPKLLEWVSDSGASALIADNYAVEGIPPMPADGKRPMLPLHHHCLFKLGLPLAELWYLSELADWLRVNGRNRFLLTAPPLRLPGAVGSPATPIATV